MLSAILKFSHVSLSLLNCCANRIFFTQLFTFAAIGVVFTFTIPPFQIPDENAHWYAAYQRTEKLFHPFSPPVEHCLYANTLPDHFDTGRIAFHPAAKVDTNDYRTLSKMQRTCLNFVLTYGYVGTYPGVIAARLIAQKENQRADRTFQVFILSRILQGLLVAGSLARLLFLIYKTRSVIPGISLLTALALSPLFIQQSFAVSADTIMLALSFYLISAMFFWNRLHLIDFLLIAALSFSLGLTKPPQIGVIPAALLAGWLMHSKSPESSPKKEPVRIWGAVAICIGTLALSIWMTLQDHRPPEHQVMGRDLDLGRQLQHIASNPFSTIAMFHRTLMSYIDITLLSGPLGWLDTPLRDWTKSYWKLFLKLALSIDMALLIGALLTHRQTFNSRLRSCIGSAVVLSAAYVSALLIIFTLYITWTPVGANGVHGLQGRYFLPLLMLAPVAFANLLVSTKHGSVVTIQQEPSRLHTWISWVFVACFSSLSMLYLSTVYTDIVRRWW